MHETCVTDTYIWMVVCYKTDSAMSERNSPLIEINIDALCTVNSKTWQRDSAGSSPPVCVCVCVCV